MTPTFGVTDINMLSAYFKGTVLFSSENVLCSNKLSDKIIVAENYINWKENSPFKLLLSNLRIFLGALIYEWRQGGIRLKQGIAAPKKLSTAWFQAEQVEKWLKLNHIHAENAVFYSFWFYDCTFMVALKKKYPNALFVTRTHSGDLYEDGTSLAGKILMRNYQLKHLDAVITISNIALKYLSNKYPKYKEKYHLHRLGTADPNCLNNLENNNSFVLLSCSHIRNVKRVHLIAEAIKHCTSRIHWMHMGAMEPSEVDTSVADFNKGIENLKDNKNISFEYLGNLSPAEVDAVYKSRGINAIISTSETEGIPVSMMEAISFGIPIISTDVGGCSEIVNPTTGILFAPDESPQKIAEIIEEFINSDMNKPGFRSNVRQYWKDNYSADVNYSKLALSFENWLN